MSTWATQSRRDKAILLACTFVVAVLLVMLAIRPHFGGDAPASSKTPSCEALWEQNKSTFLASTDDEDSVGAQQIRNHYIGNCHESRRYIREEFGQ